MPLEAAKTRCAQKVRSAVGQKVLFDVVAVRLEQHARAAQLTNLLVRPLDHAVAFTALGVHHFAVGSHLEALFGARFGLQLGHLALLHGRNTRRTREGRRPAKLLVRALKVLRFPHQTGNPAQMTATAARKSAGRSKVALMAESGRFGNDVPRKMGSPRGSRELAHSSLRYRRTDRPEPDQRGASTITTWRPSNLASCSTLAISATSPLILSKSLVPISWCAISRPR